MEADAKAEQEVPQEVKGDNHVPIEAPTTPSPLPEESNEQPKLSGGEQQPLQAHDVQVDNAHDTQPPPVIEGEREADASDSEDNQVTLNNNDKDKIVVFDDPPDNEPNEEDDITPTIQESEQFGSVVDGKGKEEAQREPDVPQPAAQPATSHSHQGTQANDVVASRVVVSKGEETRQVQQTSEAATQTSAPTTTQSQAATQTPPSSAASSSAEASSSASSGASSSSSAPSSNASSSSSAPSSSASSSSSAPSLNASSSSSALPSSAPPPATTTAASTTTTTTTTNELPPLKNAGSFSKEEIGRKMHVVNKVEAESEIFSGDVVLKKDKILLKLKPSALVWAVKTVVTMVVVKTIAGVTQKTNTFTIHACIAKKGNKREVRVFTFECKDEEQARLWRGHLHQLLNPEGRGPAGRRVTCFVNPFSGTKKAVAVFAKVRPLLEVAGIIVTLVETQKSGHAREVAQRIDPSTVDALVCVSGDGLLNEVVNGLMDREDWATAIKIPLGIVPAGSGNGLAFTLATGHPISAALSIIRGFTRPFDLLGIIQNDSTGEKRSFAFLDMTWGMISDIDIESEKNRWMGPARFTVGAAKCVLSLRKYKGKLCYLPASDDLKKSGCVEYSLCDSCTIVPDPISSDDNRRITSVFSPRGPIDVKNLPSNWVTMEADFILFIATNVSWIGYNFMASPYAHLSDGTIDLMIVRSRPEVSKPKLVNLLMQGETGEFADNPLTEHYKVKAFYLEPGPVVEKQQDNNKTGAVEKNGLLVIDGEALPSYTPLTMENYRGLINLICRE